MDPMGGQPAYAPAGQHEAAGGGGACSSCGRPLPAPDLEAVAAGIDQTLSMESGRMIARTAWAGRAPDGMMDSLLAFIPSVKKKRQLWERGQALWTERMTQAISGPCEACLGVSGGVSGSAPTEQPYVPSQAPFAPAEPPYSASPSTPAYQEPYQAQVPPTPSEPAYPGATSVMPGYGANDAPPPAGDRTSMMEPLAPDSPPLSDEDRENATTALPAFLSHAAEPPAPAAPAWTPPPAAFTPPPASAPPPSSPPPPPSFQPESDEHESHTVMFSMPVNVRASSRLVVLEGPVHGRQFSLGRQLTTIGRSIGCHVTVESDVVGYDHARVVRDDTGWRVETISGAGDTFVNDDLVREPRALQSGDVIRVGPARLRFESVG